MAVVHQGERAVLRNVVGACYDCQRVTLESNHQDLDAIRTEAESILQNLSDAQVNESPGEGRWSVGQCFSHEPFRYSVIESWFVRKMDVQSKMKFKAPKIYAPATERYTAAQLLSDFLSLQDRWESCVKTADGLHLGKIRVPTPVTRWITFSLGKNFELFLAHERRHLQQARLTLPRR